MNVIFARRIGFQIGAYPDRSEAPPKSNDRGLPITEAPVDHIQRMKLVGEKGSRSGRPKDSFPSAMLFMRKVIFRASVRMV